MITSDHSLRNKSMRARNKVAHVELLRGFARPVPRYAVTVSIETNNARNKNDFLSSEKKQKDNDDFRKVVISD